MSYPAGNPVERFFQKVNKTDACWEWTGYRCLGYGRFSIRRSTNVWAHRWSYEHFNGPIPDGLQIDHLCRNRGCVNPKHMEPVTWQENVRRGFSIPSVNRRKTHCKRGHPFDAENTYTFTNHNGRPGRGCRVCRWWLKQRRYDPAKDPEFLAEARAKFKEWRNRP